MAARNRSFRIATLLLAGAYLIITAKELIDTVHFFRDDLLLESEIGMMIFAAGHLVGACGWVVVSTAFESRIDWARLRLGGTIVGSAYVAAAIAAVLSLIPVLAYSPEADLRGSFRWGAIGAILLAVAAAVVVAGFLERRRGPAMASRLQVGMVFATLSAGALAVSLLYQQSLDSSRGFVHEVTIGVLIQAIGQFGVALAALAFTLGARWPLARREARLAAAAAGVAAGTLCIGAGQALVAAGYHSAYGPPAWQNVNAWLFVGYGVLLAGAFVYLARGARSARDEIAPVAG